MYTPPPDLRAKASATAQGGSTMNTTAAAVNKSAANTNKQQTAKEVIAANVQALIEQLEQDTPKPSLPTSPQWAGFTITALATFWKLRGRSRTQPA
jgi:hypothetical protein